MPLILFTTCGASSLDTYSWTSGDEVWAWTSSCWCIRQVAPAGLLFLGHPGLWLACQGCVRGATGRPLGPQLPLLPASASAFPFLFPFWLLVSSVLQCGNWTLQVPVPGLLSLRMLHRVHRLLVRYCDLLLLFPLRTSGHAITESPFRLPWYNFQACLPRCHPPS